MNKDPKGLWAILAPVKSIIAIAMVTNAVSVIFRIGSLVLLASSLVALLEEQPLVVFGLSLTLTNTLLLFACHPPIWPGCRWDSLSPEQAAG